MSLADLVTDWDGFEKLVATLHETGEVTVERDVVLTGRSGTPRQIDVLIRHKQGLYEHLVIAECKYWNSRVERQQVDALASAVRDLGASRGVIFSTQGFQSGAVTQAQHDAIDLFKVRDLTAQEWGLPGRVVDIFLHVIQGSIGNLVAVGASAISTTPQLGPITLNIEFGVNGPVSSTPTLNRARTGIGKTIEEYLVEAAQKSLEGAFTGTFTLNGGAECTRYLVRPTNLLPDIPFAIPRGPNTIIVPKFSFDLGIKISQSRITVDRAEKYLFALAVENCVNGQVSSAARERSAPHTVLSELRPETPPPGGEAPVTNGSVLRVFLKPFFPFEETVQLERVDFDGLPRNPLPAAE